MGTTTTYDEIAEQARDALNRLSDCSSLTDLEGFANELFDLGTVADDMSADEATPDSMIDRLEVLAEGLRDAADAVGEMAEQYTTAHMALTKMLEEV